LKLEAGSWKLKATDQALYFPFSSFESALRAESVLTNRCFLHLSLYLDLVVNKV